MDDGVLVVDTLGHVRQANPQARRLLDPLMPRPVMLADYSPALAAAMAAQADPDRERVFVLDLPSRPAGWHAAYAQRGGHLVFIEDLARLREQARQIKLAALGRLTASMAHEIRNPLAAIAQANALMEEDLREPALRQLSGLIQKNTQRLAQIVEEILNVAQIQPRDRASLPALEIDPAVGSVCSDWAVQTRSGARLHVALGAPGTQVLFEGAHLRRVLVNLLDNALRYASDQPGAIRVATAVVDGHAELQVWSDGAALPPAVEPRLFEPFFSSESRSSGLGLYICRELCERYGAQIAYQRSRLDQHEGNEFYVIMPVANGRGGPVQQTLARRPGDSVPPNGTDASRPPPMSTLF
jgi:two-component system sensor histidine kinase PilS (NtrC family)